MIKIVIESDTEDGAIFDELMRHVRATVEAVNKGHHLVDVSNLLQRRRDNVRVSTEFAQVPEAKPQFNGPGYVNPLRQNLEIVVLATKSEAEVILGILRKMIDVYGSASVRDLYDMSGIAGTLADYRWGWRSLADTESYILRTSEGYNLVLRVPELL